MKNREKLVQLAERIKLWGAESGFQQVGIADTDLTHERDRFAEWLGRGHHGTMDWLANNFEKRTQPDNLHTHTLRIVSLRMDYLPPETAEIRILKSADKAYISRYALGRDYHKLIRKRLSIIARKIDQWAETNHIDCQNSSRAFVDSAPVMERHIAEKAGLGWVGKHTLVLNEHAGSWFFLGEIYTSLALPADTHQAENKCGDCEACLKVCPTDAFTKPYELDARRCISYLTIEHKGPIPEEFREVMGNRVFGCDDCQLICPWNKYAKSTKEQAFHPRHSLDDIDLLELFCWDESTFLDKTAGSPIRRIGYEKWQRNLAIGLGNATQDKAIINKLENALPASSPLVKEHIEWALIQQKKPRRTRKRKLKSTSR